MSYTDTTKLGLKKADPGTNQPFETSVMNANWDDVDAEFVAVDARLDLVEAKNTVQDGRLTAVEADNWVTSARLADGAVGVNELAANAVTSAKIADGNVGNSELGTDSVTTSKIVDAQVTSAKIADLNVTVGKLAASLDLSGKTVSVATQSAGNSSTLAASTAFVGAAIAAKGLPAKMKAARITGTVSGGQLTYDITSWGFTATPVVTANVISNPTPYTVTVYTNANATSVTFYMVNPANGSVFPTGSTVTLNVIAMQP